MPVRASIYIAPDGSVQFGALFAELLPVARALGAAPADVAKPDPPAARAGEPAEGE